LEPKKSKKDSESLELFMPIGKKDLRKLYPELNSYEEFKGLHFKDMLFVWRLTMTYSEEVDEKERVELALRSSYDGSELDSKKSMSLRKLDYPRDIERAIKKMESFDLPVRLMARNMTETILLSYQKMLKIVSGKNIEAAFKDKDNTLDWAKFSSYVNATTKMNESLPLLIKQLEDGYGFKEKKSKKNKENKAGSAIERHLDNKNK